MGNKQLLIKGFVVGLGFWIANVIIFKLLPMITGFITLALTK